MKYLQWRKAAQLSEADYSMAAAESRLVANEGWPCAEMVAERRRRPVTLLKESRNMAVLT